MTTFDEAKIEALRKANAERVRRIEAAGGRKGETWTARDEFAAQAMQALMPIVFDSLLKVGNAQAASAEALGEAAAVLTTAMAWNFADRMLAERAK